MSNQDHNQAAQHMQEPEARLSRRGFLTTLQGFLAAVGVTALFAPVIAFFWPAKLEETPSDPVPVGDKDSIAPGDAQTVRFGRYPAIVINTPGKGLVAYSAVCTHFACLVAWDPEAQVLACPCHEGYFDPSDGSVISGPPPAPLESIPLKITDGTIFIGGEA
ncbi:MAG: ubiquinol-cytochrome c reductase iron-sulfur subunit [Anaerolineales bacterium]|nr:ubiquinol-cytochrome c reductase iron-sulfur subunit [Anaerolineales bacterium]